MLRTAPATNAGTDGRVDFPRAAHGLNLNLVFQTELFEGEES